MASVFCALSLSTDAACSRGWRDRRLTVRDPYVSSQLRIVSALACRSPVRAERTAAGGCCTCPRECATCRCKQRAFCAGCRGDAGRSRNQRGVVRARASAGRLAPAAGACAATDVRSCYAVPRVLPHRAELCEKAACARERDGAERRSSHSRTEPRPSCCIENERTERREMHVCRHLHCFGHVQPSAELRAQREVFLCSNCLQGMPCFDRRSSRGTRGILPNSHVTRSRRRCLSPAPTRV